MMPPESIKKTLILLALLFFASVPVLAYGCITTDMTTDITATPEIVRQPKPTTRSGLEWYFEPSIYNGIWEGTIRGSWTDGSKKRNEYKASVILTALGHMQYAPVGGKFTVTEVTGTANLSWGRNFLKVNLRGLLSDFPPEHIEWMKLNNQNTTTSNTNTVTIDEPRTLTLYKTPASGTDYVSIPVLASFTFTIPSDDTLVLSHLEGSYHNPGVSGIEEEGSLTRVSDSPYPFTAGELVRTFPSLYCRWTPHNIEPGGGHTTLPAHYGYQVTGWENIEGADCLKDCLRSLAGNETLEKEDYFWFSRETLKCLRVVTDNRTIEGPTAERAANARFSPILNYLYQTWLGYCQMGIAIAYDDKNVTRIGTEDVKLGEMTVNIVKVRSEQPGSSEYTEIWRGMAGGIKMAFLEYKYYSPDKWFRYEVVSLDDTPIDFN